MQRGSDLLHRHGFDPTQEEDETIASREATEQRRDRAQRLTAFHVVDDEAWIQQRLGALERQPRARAPVTQLRLQRVNGDGVDEAAEAIRLPQRLRRTKHLAEDLLRQIFGFAPGPEGAFGRGQHHRREPMPNLCARPILVRGEGTRDIGVPDVATRGSEPQGGAGIRGYGAGSAGSEVHTL